MKKFFLSLVALMVAAVSFAQNTLVATLSHGDNISMYYGTYALRDAMNAAASGDVINLSGGTFQSTNISKGVTLRGTGINDVTPTIIINNFSINIPSDDTNRLSMEGIRCTGTIAMLGTFSNAYFLKCEFNSFDYDRNSNIKNTMFVDCKITGNDFFFRGTSAVQFINSYVAGFNNDSGTTASASFVNCVIRAYINSYYNQSNASYIKNSQLVNCIIFKTTPNWGATQLPSTTIATNCISIDNTSLFNNSQTNPNCWYASFEEVFKNFDDQTFELTDEAKARFIGTDGTEVGIYGGVMPYDPTPSYPQITKMNVANKTTADGKLSVEIEVSAAE